MIEETSTSGTMHRDYMLGVYPERSRRKLAAESGNASFASRVDLRDYYAYARYYDPRLGRFMSPDPLAGNVGNPQSLNRYTYVTNNPTNVTDPLGLNGAMGICMAAGRQGGGADVADQACGNGPTEGEGGGGGTCLVDGGATSCDMVGLLVTSASIGQMEPCSTYVGCVTALRGFELDLMVQENLATAKPAFTLAANPNGSTRACVQDVLHKAGTTTSSGPTLTGLYHGHRHYQFAVAANGELLTLIARYTEVPPDARIPVDIGGHIWGWHVEWHGKPPGNPYNTHFDVGDPNWDGLGVFEHVFEDFILGGLRYTHSGALDPKC